MIKIKGHLICKNSEETDLIRQLLPEHTRLTKKEAGCISFDVTETTDPLIWKIEEFFKDKTAFDNHQKRTLASAWGKETSSIIRDYIIFEIT
ncbi:Quinol monooxygenase YgiN [Kosakonia arachidis]|uniref:Quinol monooxygenase YgiN n=1 Tax=Kosakonia arachidis TaxID=551989 RepID=A0A1I7EC58_9ENTR|nr:antibiotic biosynthesis monooxygenase [Kosakonia arachidis]SFU21489.1 Quinol monooxygenase YgiN [Kosakonia arachidis]